PPRSRAVHATMHVPRPVPFVYCNAHHPPLHSFPTRRSSDLPFRPVRLCHPHRRRGARLRRQVLPAAEGRQEDGHLHPLRSGRLLDRKSTRLNSSHVKISYAVFCLKKKRLREQRRVIDVFSER